VSPLLAQIKNDDDQVLIVLLVVIGVILLVSLIVGIFFLLTLHRALARCAPHNRRMEPGMVWLNLVPLLSLVWMFITVSRVAETLRNEFRDRGWHRRDDDYGNGVGMAACGLNIASIIPYIGGCLGLAALVCFIIYWVKIAGYSGRLATRHYSEYEDHRYDDRDDDYEDYDDRPRRRERDRDRDDRDEDDRPWDRGR
jgi:hypothetical protein